MNRVNKKYVISFNKTGLEYLDHNWATISSIDKKTFNQFINYLYSLKRNIPIQPYISGGLVGPMHAVLDLDKTFKVEMLVEAIKNKVPKDRMLNYFLNYSWILPKPKIDIDNKYNIHFIEDVYELLIPITNDVESIFYYIKKKITRVIEMPDEKFDNIELWHDIRQELTNFNNNSLLPQLSRWVFVYMFRHEFRSFMNKRGYEVIVDGGWVLNDKKRELSLGLIDKDGNYTK